MVEPTPENQEPKIWVFSIIDPHSPAFPNYAFNENLGFFTLDSELTKRELLAAFALNGYLSAFAGAATALPDCQQAATSSVNYADALIEALETIEAPLS